MAPRKNKLAKIPVLSRLRTCEGWFCQFVSPWTVTVLVGILLKYWYTKINNTTALKRPTVLCQSRIGTLMATDRDSHPNSGTKVEKIADAMMLDVTGSFQSVRQNCLTLRFIYELTSKDRASPAGSEGFYQPDVGIPTQLAEQQVTAVRRQRDIAESLISPAIEQHTCFSIQIEAHKKIFLGLRGHK